MHSYLRAIGFSKYKSRKQLEKPYLEALANPNRKVITTVNTDTSLLQFEKDFAPSIGIALIGEYDIKSSVSIEHYYPYIKGDVFTTSEHITIENLAANESYAGISEVASSSVTLIFYLQNIADYAKSKWLNFSNRNLKKVRFSGLSIKGAILLPLKKSEEEIENEANYNYYKNNILSAARNGDFKALEALAITEMDTVASITNRLGNEDLFSIVNTSLIPSGVECDHYFVLGNIINVKKLVNQLTKETVYNLLLEVNTILINIGINQIDLQGEPEVGRRFRGEIWLQGHVKI